MATFKLRAPSLAGSTLTLFIGALGGAVANGSGDAMTESSGLFSATVAESLSGEYDYWVVDSDSDTVWQGRVYCSGDTWIADDMLGRVFAKTQLITSSGIVQVEESSSTIRLKTGSTKTKTVSVSEDLSGKTLKLYVSTMDEAYFAQFTLTVGNGYFAFTPTTALTLKNRDFKYAVREPGDGKNVLYDGLLEVDFAADE